MENRCPALLDNEADVLANEEILEEKVTLFKKMDEEVQASMTDEKEVVDEIGDAGMSTDS